MGRPGNHVVSVIDDCINRSMDGRCLHSRSVPSLPTDDAAVVTTVRAICDEFEAYG